jgi:hypothetical protein
MQVALPADPNHCPLCGQPNECAMEIERATGVKQPPCWCSLVKFEASLAVAHSRTCPGQGLYLPGLRAGRNALIPRPPRAPAAAGPHDPG